MRVQVKATAQHREDGPEKLLVGKTEQIIAKREREEGGKEGERERRGCECVSHVKKTK